MPILCYYCQLSHIFMVWAQKPDNRIYEMIYLYAGVASDEELGEHLKSFVERKKSPDYSPTYFSYL